MHRMKSVQILSLFWSVFSSIRTEFLRFTGKYRKIETRKNSVFRYFSHSDGNSETDRVI